MNSPVQRALGAVFFNHGLQLGHARDRINDLKHPALGFIHRCNSHIDQQALLAMDPLDIPRNRPHYPAARPCLHPVDDLKQQVDQRVRSFRHGDA